MNWRETAGQLAAAVILLSFLVGGGLLFKTVFDFIVEPASGSRTAVTPDARGEHYEGVITREFGMRCYWLRARRGATYPLIAVPGPLGKHCEFVKPAPFLWEEQ